MEDKVLVSDSLQETLWRLEEVRQGFRSTTTTHVQEALEWVLSRQGLSGSYCNLFSPTEKDLFQGVQLLTGERYPSRRALTRHVLGEEALRTTIVWKVASSPAVTDALKGFEQILERGGRSGHYCCYTCTLAFLRTMVVVKPDGWNAILQKGLNKLSNARMHDGKWHGYPFYYTLLTLSEMDTSAARAELRHAQEVAQKLLKRYPNNDRTSLFRKLALKAALKVT